MNYVRLKLGHAPVIIIINSFLEEEEKFVEGYGEKDLI
jgi:hypothetical protein